MTQSVDEIISKEQETISQKLDNIIEQTRPDSNDSNAKEDAKPAEKPADPEPADEPEAAADSEDTQAEDKQTAGEAEAEKKPDADSELDDYGNKVNRQQNKRTSLDDDKLYTKAELNQAINQAVRDRLERFRGSEAQKNNIEDRVQEKMQESGVNPNDENAWQKELKHFIKETLDEEENQRKQAEEQARYQRQVEEDRQSMQIFQEKFVSGMEKYPDFKEVVSGIQMTDSMMIAIKDLKDPAGFVRAAAKLKPAEVNRIASLRDPVAQAVAMGRLEESLLVNAKKQTSAPKAISKPKGDTGVRERPQHSVDQLIEIDRVKKFGA